MAGFTIPDKGTADNDIQSILFKEYIEVLADGIQGNNCVLFGLAVTGGADMTPALAKGAVLSNGVMYAVAAADATITSAHETLPRIDLIVITSAGAIAVRAGTAATAPKPPARTANDVVLYAVYVPAADTAIATTQCIDMRVFARRPQLVKKVTTAVVKNNDNAIYTYLTCTMGSGLMAAGTIAHVVCGGTYLFNSATQPTPILTISYGGTSMFVDTGLLSTADADRGAWKLDFRIIAQSLTDQQLIGDGIMTNTVTGAHVPPSTGQAGNIAGSLAVANRPVSWEMSGTATVDSDAADRDILVRWTMGGSSNANNEMTMEFAVVTLE
jgi:hypothetical protein